MLLIVVGAGSGRTFLRNKTVSLDCLRFTVHSRSFPSWSLPRYHVQRNYFVPKLHLLPQNMMAITNAAAGIVSPATLLRSSIAPSPLQAFSRQVEG